MTWTLTTSGAAILKAGAHANSTIIASGASLVIFSNHAEGMIEEKTRRKWVDNYAGLPTGIKNCLSDVASSYIAMNIVCYDPTGYLPRESDFIMNFNDEVIAKGLQELKDFKSNTLQNP